MTLEFIEQEDGGPLCPTLDAPEHRVRVRTVDAFYEVMKEGHEDLTERGHEIYNAAVYGKNNTDRMRLYRVTGYPALTGRASSVRMNGGWIESWYWQCPTCNFVLPAYQVRGWSK